MGTTSLERWWYVSSPQPTPFQNGPFTIRQFNNLATHQLLSDEDHVAPGRTASFSRLASVSCR